MVTGKPPDGWALKTVEELYEVIGGGTPSTAIPEYWNGDIPWITSADIAGLKDIQPRKKITKDAIANSATGLVPAGSLIVVTRVSLGKVALTSYPLCFSQDSQALIAKDKSVLPEYALYYLAQATQIFRYQGRGTTISGVTKKQLKELPFPLPPLPEQERIVAKIEELFTQLEAGTSALERVQAGLRGYKASVLKEAVSGRLVNGDLEHGDGELPEGWIWSTVEELNPPNRKCAYGVLQPGVDKSDGVLFVRVGDINEGVVDLQNLKRIDPKIVAKYPRTKLQGGEVLITLVGAIGRTAVVPESLAGANTARAVGVIPIKDGVDPQWVEIWFRNPEKITEMTSKAHEVARKTLNLEDVRAANVALPPLEDQHRIVAEVERRLSVARQVESAVEEALVRASRLRQAVLKSAFEGRLT